MQGRDHVGSACFRENLGRLTVCKQWFKFARAACFKELQLSQKTLRCLLSSRDVERSLLLVKDSLEILYLKLMGFEDWDSIPEPQSYANAFDASSWDGDYGRALLVAWTIALDNNLAQLAIVAKESRKLGTIRIQASSEHHLLLVFPAAIISCYPRYEPCCR